jgi:hypothetical protein
MPFLPLDHPEPFAATLGVMLYPGTNEDERRRASAFAAQWISASLREPLEAGVEIPQTLLMRIAADAGAPLTDIQERWWRGTMTGQIFKALYALYCTGEALASWSNAIRLAEHAAQEEGAKAGRSTLWDARSKFLNVAHLWAAWVIREGRFEPRLEVGYDGRADTQSFLTEAEILRQWGQSWIPSRDMAEPPLPVDVWRPPDGWRPPERQPGWPETGGVHALIVPDELLGLLRPAGRPRKSG